MDGRCACNSVQYRLRTRPLFVHCCHCHCCQRETGAAFAINILIETSSVEIISGAPETIHTPSASGKGQDIVRCPDCQVALWSHYPGMGPSIAFIRAGTLDAPELCPPDIHIYTDTKLPWVELPDGVPAVSEYYDMKHHWPPESWARFKAARLAGHVEE